VAEAPVFAKGIGDSHLRLQLRRWCRCRCRPAQNAGLGMTTS